MKTFCISHKKDVDGLGSAALVSAATRSEVVLSDYEDLIENLSRVPEGAQRVVLCDLGVDNSNLDAFLKAITKVSERAEVTYIDHHFMTPDTKRKLKRAGVTLVHDEAECSSVLAYKKFKNSLPENARFVALFGAVTDYLDDSPTARKLMEQTDRQFVLLEATLLAYALGKKGKEDAFRKRVVFELAKMSLPHEIKGVPEYAIEQLAETVRLGETVRREGTKMGTLAYMVTTEHSTGNIAKLLIGAFDVPVGVALKDQEGKWWEVSLRSTSECKVHLGKTITRIANKLGGNGGGHRKAAGCRIPFSTKDQMLAELVRKV